MDSHVNYTAILLAAGYGSRIAEVTTAPKCLLEVNGKSLLAHHFESWLRQGIKKAHVVLGHEAQQIEAALRPYEKQIAISYSYNHDYKTKGNTYSLWCALKDVSGPILIFDADLLYEDRIIADFLAHGPSDQILVGTGKITDIECAKVLIDGAGFIRKTVDKRAIHPDELAQYTFVGEALGILKFSAVANQALTLAASDFLENENNILLNWEHLLNQFLGTYEVRAYYTESENWIEIDTPEDFERAQEIFHED